MKWGFKQALEAIRHLDAKDQERLLKNVAQLDTKLAEQLKSSLFQFSDLPQVNDEGFKFLFGQIEESKWCLALRNATEEVKAHIQKNISHRRWQLLQETILSKGPQPVSEVEKAQSEIAQKVTELEKEGKLIIQKPDSHDPLV